MELRRTILRLETIDISFDWRTSDLARRAHGSRRGGGGDEHGDGCGGGSDGPIAVR
jgi:hypothetical protein